MEHNIYMKSVWNTPMYTMKNRYSFLPVNHFIEFLVIFGVLSFTFLFIFKSFEEHFYGNHTDQNHFKSNRILTRLMK